MQATVHLCHEYLGGSSPEFQELADALLIVDNEQLPVNKAVLAAKSPTFTRLFTSCSATARPDAKIEVPLDDSLLVVGSALHTSTT